MSLLTHICQLLPQHYKIDNIPSLLEQVNVFSPEELKTLYCSLWTGTQSEFAEQYNLNRGNFNKWIQGTRSCSPPAMNAVILFIHDLFSQQPNPRIRSIDIKTHHSVEEEITILNDAMMTTSSTIKHLMFIDSDNDPRSLDVLLPPYTPPPGLYIVSVFTANGFCWTTQHLISVKCPWFFVLHSNLHVKDAADHMISLCVMHFGRLLPETADIIIVSNDHFIEEVAIDATLLIKRKCSSYPHDSLGEILSSLTMSSSV